MKAIKGKTIFSGIHVKDMKELSKDCRTEIMAEPATVVISSSQSLGKPATVCVSVGEHVLRGQLIADADGVISSDVFASVSGDVVEIKEVTGTNGNKETCVVIKNDFKNQEITLPPLSDTATAEEIIERIKNAGIVGLGGAGFPTAVKVSPKTKVDTLILNGAECEPYLTCDHRLMVEYTDEIVRGARYVAKAIGVSNVIIGIENNKPDCIAAFEKYGDVKVVVLKKRYPMGSEKHLIYSTTGRKVGIGKLPADSGVIVQNVATAYYVCEAVEKGKTLTERIITVSGQAVENPKNLWVKIGTPLSDIIAFCGGEKSKPVKLIQGGPMTGTALYNLNAYTHKTTSGILLLSDKEAKKYQPTACLSCGKCADSCPMRLMPMNTEFYASAGDYESAIKLGNALSCIECGVCEYVCPAKRPLIQSIRKTKAYARNKK